MTAHTVTLALEGWFTKPLNKLPLEERSCAEAYIKNWSELSPSERRERAVEVDRQRAEQDAARLTHARSEQARQNESPAEDAEKLRAWWDVTMAADHWFSLVDVDPLNAAMLLCRFNPNSETVSEAESNRTDQTGPSDFLQLRRRFEDWSRAETRPRTLRDWLHAAKAMPEERYHSWIDEYVDAVDVLTPGVPPWSAAPLAPVAPVATTEAQAGSEKQQAQGRRGWREVAWPYMVAKLCDGQYATAKELDAALRAGAGVPESPFDKGEGQNRGSLFVREIGRPLMLKTIQNNWQKLREAARS